MFGVTAGLHDALQTLPFLRTLSLWPQQVKEVDLIDNRYSDFTAQWSACLTRNPKVMRLNPDLHSTCSSRFCCKSKCQPAILYCKKLIINSCSSCSCSGCCNRLVPSPGRVM